MRILYFAPKACWPPTTGALVRNYYLARELSRGASVTYLSFADDANGAHSTSRAPAPQATAGSARAEVDAMGWAERTITVAREPAYTLTKLLRGAVGPLPITVLNYATRAMAHELGRVLRQQNFDIVQVESIHLATYLPIIRSAHNKPLAVCDWHNIESDLMKQYSDHVVNPFRRVYAQRTSRQLNALERRAAREFDAHVTVTESDRARLREFCPDARAYVIPNGVDTDYYSDERMELAHSSLLASINHGRSGKHFSQNLAHPQAACNKRFATCRNRIVFVGSMDYHANVHGVVEFARLVWPSIQATSPDLIFTVVGRNPAFEIRQLADIPGVEVTGTVEDVRPFYREALAAMVPLRVGGGSRLKILEAMAAGVPVISTRLGAEGIEVSDGQNILFAETGDEFSRMVAAISADEEKWRKLANAGRALVREKYDWAGLGGTLINVYRELLREQ